MLLLHATDRPCSFALDNAGSSNAARIAMMAITTSNSIRVKPPAPPCARRSQPDAEPLKVAAISSNFHQILSVPAHDGRNQTARQLCVSRHTRNSRGQPSIAAQLRQQLLHLGARAFVMLFDGQLPRAFKSRPGRRVIAQRQFASAK